MRVLHLPEEVGGNAFGLAQGERALGLESETFSTSSSLFNFPSDQKFSAKGLKVYELLKLFLQYRNLYDVYHFNFGSSLIHYPRWNINLLDLPFYDPKSLKIVTYQGCDARQKYPTMKRVDRQKQFSACHNANCYNGVCNSGRKDIERRKGIEKMMEYCQHAFAVNPDLLHFLPKEKASFLPYSIPNFEKIPLKFKSFFQNDKIHIVHAPTQRAAKGTEYILKALNHLKEIFPNLVTFELIENLPYSEALKRYQKADLVIDQVQIGWYGGFAVEVMKMGIPVIAYINEFDLEFVPDDFAKELPIIKTSPLNITENIIKIIKEREQLIEIGKLSNNFVEKWHHPMYVASLTKEKYEILRQQ
jgi:hypothetical protein